MRVFQGRTATRIFVVSLTVLVGVLGVSAVGITGADAGPTATSIGTEQVGPGGQIASGSIDATRLAGSGLDASNAHTIAPSAGEGRVNVSASQRGVRNVTLITGQRITVLGSGANATYVIDADVTMHRIETPSGTYVFPAGVDFDTFDRSLFNVDLLLEQGLSNAASDSIPVIVKRAQSVDEHGYGGDGPAVRDRTLSTLESKRSLGSIDAVAGEIPKANAGAAIEELRRSDSVEAVYLDRRIDVALHEATPLIAAAQARNRFGLNSSGINVSVLDTGIDETHPDLDEGTVILAKDFTTDNTTEDKYGHGTHVAGIITGDGDAGSGSHVGVAPNASVFNARVLNTEGFGRTSWIVDAIEWSVNHSADVISMSLGGPVNEGDLLMQASNWAVEQGVPVVASAGNAGEYFTVGSPGAAARAITVGASTKDDHMAGFSSKGPTPLRLGLKPDVVAPGQGIVSARASGTSMGNVVDEYYTSASGTSMAAPMVSGAVALVQTAHPGWSPLRIKNALLTTATPIADSSGERYDAYVQGAGRINVSRAIATDVVIRNASTSLGVFMRDTLVNRTLTIHNVGDDTRTLSATVVAESDIRTLSSGRISLNRSQVVLDPGESAAVRVTVNTDVRPGVYSGRLRFENGSRSYTAVVGFARANEVTIEKRARSGTQTDVQDDPFLLFEHTEFAGSEYEWTRRGDIDDGTASVLAFDGTVTAWSVGTDESTGTPILTSNTTTIQGNTTIVLDESDTVAYSLDSSGIDASHRPLSNLSVEANLQQQLDSGERIDVFHWSTSTKYPASRTVRFSPGSSVNASVEYLLQPEAYNATGQVDSPVLYHVEEATVGVSGAREFALDPSTLARNQRRLYRTTPGQTYSLVSSLRPDTWRTISSAESAYEWGIGDRYNQTVYLTPDADYRTSARVDGQWTLEGNSMEFPAGEVTSTAINRHPYTSMGTLDVFDGSDLYLYRGFQADQPTPESWGAAWYNNHHEANRMIVRKDGSVVADDLTSESYAYYYEQGIANDTAFNVTLIGNNRAGSHDGTNLSTRTRTGFFFTHVDGGDSEPPSIERLAVTHLSLNNSVPADEVPVEIDVRDASSIASLRVLYTASSDDRAWTADTIDPAGTWESAELLQAGDPTSTFLLNLSGHAGQRIDIAVVAEDAAGNVMATTTRNAVRVVSGSVDLDLATVSGRLDEADGTPAARDLLVWENQETHDEIRNVTSARGDFAVTLTKNVTYDVRYYQKDPRDDSAVWYPKDGTVDMVPIGQMTPTKDRTGLNGTLPEGHNLTVTVVNESGMLVENAHVRIWQSRETPDGGHVSASIEAPTNASGDLVHPRSDGPGFEVNGTVHVNVYPPQDASLIGNETEITVDRDRHVRVVLSEAVTVSGRIESHAGEAVSDGRIAFDGVNAMGTDHFEGDRLASGGNFSVRLVRNGTYDATFEQRDFEGVEYADDEVPDVHAFGRSTYASDANLGAVTLPEGHDLNVTVLTTEGEPVEGAEVSITDVAGDARVTLYGFTTDSRGVTYHPEWGRWGIDANGTVEIDVEPPSETYTGANETIVNVTSDANVTVRLERVPTTTISGRLEYPDGSPVPGWRVYTQGIEGTDSDTDAQTNATGAFTTTVAQDGTYSVEYAQRNASRSPFPKDGYPDLQAIRRVQVGSGPVDLGTIRLGQAHLVNVTVVTEDGTPVTAADVTVGHIDPSQEIGVYEPATLGSDGEVWMENANAPGVEINGTMFVRVDPDDPDLVTAREEFDVHGRRNVTIVVEGRVSVSGRLNESDGTPAARDLLVWENQETHDEVRNVTSARGDFAASLAANVTYDVKYYQKDPRDDSAIWYPKDGSVDLDASIQAAPAEDLTGLNGTLPEGHNLTVTVVNESGVPIQNAQVDLIHHAEREETGETAHAYVSAPTNASGDLVHPKSDGPGFEVNGTVHVNVDPPDGTNLASNGTTVTVESDTHLRIVLPDTVRATGWIARPDGTPAARNLVVFDGLVEAPNEEQLTSSDGNFSIGLREGGTYDAVFRERTPADDAVPEFPTNGVPDIYAVTRLENVSTDVDFGRVDLPAAHDLNVTVVDESGTPIEDAHVHITHRNGKASAHFDAPTNARGMLEHPESDGPGVEVNGTVTVHVEPPSEEYLDNGTQLTVTGATSVTIVLQRDRVSLTGRVNLSDGSPAVGDSITAETLDNEVVAATGTNDDGTYALEVPPEETYDVDFVQVNETADHFGQRDGFADLYPIARAYVDSSTDLGTAEVPQGYPVNVTVLNESGAPVQGARVTIEVHDPAGGEADLPANPTNADGLMVARGIEGTQLNRSDVPGLELRGNVTITVRPPDGSAGFVQQSYVRNLNVTSRESVTVTLEEAITVSGRILVGGSPGVDDFVAANNGGFEVRRTDGSGNFSIPLAKDTAYSLTYAQWNETAGTPAKRDGYVDVYEFESVNRSSSLDLGEVSIPTGHVLNVSVVDENGDPVQGAAVHVRPDAVPGIRSVALGQPNTTAEGFLKFPNEPPGIEVTGNVTIEVTPPDDPRFAQKTYTRNVTVTSDHLETVTLNASQNQRPSASAVLQTTTNNAGSPLRVGVEASDDRNVSEVVLLVNGTAVASKQCASPTCAATLTTTPSSSTWTGSRYSSLNLTVVVTDDAGLTTTTSLSTPVYAAGDVTGDGKVDISDAGLIGQAWKSSRGASDYSDAADLNNDGRVDVFDLVLLGRNWHAGVTTS